MMDVSGVIVLEVGGMALDVGGLTCTSDVGCGMLYWLLVDFYNNIININTKYNSTEICAQHNRVLS